MSEPAPGAIARLEAEGELVADGRQFTLDTAAARAKLADYRLADPHAWVLLVVEAATLLGAKGVEFEINNAATRARILGAQLELAKLGRLFDAVFADRGAPQVEAQRRLAIAFDTASSLEARRVELSHAGQALVLEAGELAEQASTDAGSEGFGAALTTLGPVREREQLRTKAAFADLPVVLDGERISSGFVVHAGFARRRFGPERGPGRGLITWDSLGDRTGIYLIASGVVIEQLSGEDWTASMVALVDASALERDLSLSRFVRNEAFERLVAHAQAAHDSFDFGALRVPRVRGELPKVESLTRHLPVAYVALFFFLLLPVLVSVFTPLGGIAEMVMLISLAGVLGSVAYGVGVYMQLPRDATPDVIGPPAVARLESRAKVLKSLGPVSKVEFRARVVASGRQPYSDKLVAWIPSAEIESYAPGEWLWVHLRADGYRGLLYDDRAGSERPMAVLAHAKAPKALPPASS